MSIRNRLLRGTLFSLLLAVTSTAMCQVGGRRSFDEARQKLVEEDIVAAGVEDPRVVQAMRDTPRHEFVPRDQQQYAYVDMALPIGDRQTISAPFIVAYMTEQIDPQPTDKVLEIGTGSGYQAAVLSPLVKEVYTIEIVEPLGKRAARALTRLGYKNVFTKIGDGYEGWPEHAPFDKIIVTCSPEDVPPKLVEQLAEGGRMIIPVGERYQQTLYLLTKKGGKLVSEKLLPTLFVPMTGAAEEQRKVLPDPSRPELLNHDFEEVDADTGRPAHWHHPRQAEVVQSAESPSGERHLLFTNSVAGQDSHVLQGFAIDGRKIRELQVTVRVRAGNVQPGQTRDQMPMIVVNFFDQGRDRAGPPGIVGPWRDSFGWKEITARLTVPSSTREAILHVGLLGAVGELAVDRLELKPVSR